jgi:hypothetical protein
MGCGASKNSAPPAVDLKKVSTQSVSDAQRLLIGKIGEHEQLIFSPQVEEERVKAEAAEIARKEAAEAEARLLEKQKEKERLEQEKLQREAEEAERLRIEEERLAAEAAQREKEELEVGSCAKIFMYRYNQMFYLIGDFQEKQRLAVLEEERQLAIAAAAAERARVERCRICCIVGPPGSIKGKLCELISQVHTASQAFSFRDSRVARSCQ